MREALLARSGDCHGGVMVAQGCRGATAGRESNQPDFAVTSAGPGLQESGPDQFTLAIFKNSTVF